LGARSERRQDGPQKTMNFIALKMLDRAKYLGIVMGLTFASLLLTQQSGIFVG
jgi:putative ABC transport system permease protein